MNWGQARDWAASWERGDLPAWGAFLLGAAALWISIKAQRDGAKSVEEAKLSRLASERSAAAAEATLGDQRREAAERRAAEAEANRPRPSFAIERATRNSYYLRNTGTGRATGLTLSAREEPYIFTGVTDGDLAPNEAVQFQMLGAAGRPVPGTLYVTWDGQSEETSVAVPG
ncbi:hypothetical protein [Streptomyces sp. NPDC059651]|uniref:hypothetical protein n=1 Tax=Streptomyces sp. NPDC059651 TaxID=3346897 RepID=UPI0036804CB9